MYASTLVLVYVLVYVLVLCRRNHRSSKFAPLKKTLTLTHTVAGAGDEKDESCRSTSHIHILHILSPLIPLTLHTFQKDFRILLKGYVHKLNLNRDRFSSLQAIKYLLIGVKVLY